MAFLGALGKISGRIMVLTDLTVSILGFDGSKTSKKEKESGGDNFHSSVRLAFGV